MKKYSVLYQHRTIIIADEWYADVQVTSIDPSFDRATLPDVLSVKHGWPVDNIVVTDALENLLPGVPFVDYRVGHRLRKLHLEGRTDPSKWRKDLKVLIRWAPGGLRADDSIQPDFSL
ncbi:MAG TPA: hypothetical protein V6D04_13525 [Candidatus Obscuribacterales bacterium]